MTGERIPHGIRCRLYGAPILVLLGGALLCQRPGVCQTALNERVLVVYNSSASESLSIARHYMAQRQIPESHRCKISVDSVDYLKQDEFESRVKAPVRKCIEAVGKQKVLYIVFSYQTPYVVTVQGRGFALDSFYRRHLGRIRHLSARERSRGPPIFRRGTESGECLYAVRSVG